MAESPRRSDGRRNRQRLLEVALAAFSSEEKVPLETIAKDAGVGIGTLYRHFPTRESLIEAVYRTELERVCSSAEQLLRRYEPAEALRRWMRRYADFVATKRGMADALGVIVASGAISSAQTRAILTDTIQSLLDAGAESGTLRSDVRAEDVSASLAGIFLATRDNDQRAQAARMLELLVDGLRPRS